MEYYKFPLKIGLLLHVLVFQLIIIVNKTK